ncbi:YncE family protein [Micromonospora sp. NPDC092111]|uniref:YncE family protein n=1 Tax=Micromonospora sp. NPDC092111 TaxID=3364289 RepID=UPI003822681B
MRVKQIARLMVAALGATFVVVSPLGSGVAYAESTVGLGIETYSAMVVDPAHGRLFFSPGRGGAGVRVTDLSGGSQTTIPGLPDAHGMVLSPDGSTLHVALREAGAVAAIDTTTLTETARYSVGTGTCPTWLAPAGGKLYFGYGCTFGKGLLGSIDVRGGTPVVALGLPLDGTFTGPPLLRSSPADPDLLLATDRSSVTTPYSSRATRYDVSSGTPSLVASLPWDACTGLHDAALTPDAGKVILGCSFVNGRTVAATAHVAFSTTDLSAAGEYPSGRWPTAVTTSPNGSFVIVGSTDRGQASAIRVERPDGTLVRRYDLPQGSYLERQGLAVGADNSTLYAVTTDQDGRNPTLRVLTDITRTGSTLTLSAPSTSTHRQKVTVTGSLAFTGASVSTPWTLRVARTDLTGTHPLPDVTTTATGTFSFSDTPRFAGANTYTVTFPGDAVYLGTSQSVTVQVSSFSAATRQQPTTTVTPRR